MLQKADNLFVQDDFLIFGGVSYIQIFFQDIYKILHVIKNPCHGFSGRQKKDV